MDTRGHRRCAALQNGWLPHWSDDITPECLLHTINTPTAAFMRGVSGGQHNTLCVCLVAPPSDVAWGVMSVTSGRADALSGTFHRGCATCALTRNWQGSLVDTAARARMPGMARWGDPQQMEAGPASGCSRTDWWMPVSKVMTPLCTLIPPNFYRCRPSYKCRRGRCFGANGGVSGPCLRVSWCAGRCAEASFVGYVWANWHWQLACLGYTLHKPYCAHMDACMLGCFAAWDVSHIHPVGLAMSVFLRPLPDSVCLQVYLLFRSRPGMHSTAAVLNCMHLEFFHPPGVAACPGGARALANFCARRTLHVLTTLYAR